MGIKLSSSGGLTYSQKQSCGGDKKRETALLKKLSSMEINKPILAGIARKQKEKAEKATQRRQEKSSATTKRK